MSAFKPPIWRKHKFVLLRALIRPVLQLTIPIGWVVIARLGPEPLASAPTAYLLGIAIVLAGTWAILSMFTKGVKQAAESSNSQSQKTISQRVAFSLGCLATPFRFILMAAAIGCSFYFWGLIAGFEPFKELWAGSLSNVFAVLYCVYYLMAMGWLIWSVINWWNDQYILTQDRILDIVVVPFPFPREQRTEARLTMVQNVTAKFPGFFERFFDFGDVDVETAGRTGVVHFVSVPHPRQIQSAIFRQVEQLQEAERGRRQAEFGEWFDVFHTVTNRVVILKSPNEVRVNEPIIVEWRIGEDPNATYVSNIHWDLTSHSKDNSYPNETPPKFGRIGNYEDRFHVPMPGTVYFKVRAVVPAADVYWSFERTALVIP